MSGSYNMIVIGGGAAGLVTSYIAAAVKARVALIEQDKMGGDCLNTGCVPSKALIRSANFVYNLKRHKELGVHKLNYELKFSDIMERTRKIIHAIEPHDSTDRYTKLGVECLHGTAEIIDRNTVRLGDRILKTANIVLAQGAEPFIPPITGLDKIRYLTSDNLWSLQELPKKLVILGAGPIGCELAQAFSRLGSDVTIAEQLPRILMREDEDVAAFIGTRFHKEGIRILTGHKAIAVESDANQTYLICEDSDGTKAQRIAFDSLLIAVGRKARTNGTDWESLGICLRKDGTIDVDDYLRANKKNIFAAGDVTGPWQFTHMAAHQAYYAAVNALFRPMVRFRVNYKVVPWVTYTDPEIAHVGLNEKDAREQGIDYDRNVYGIDDLDRALTDSEAHGFVKVLTEKGSSRGRILGATIVSHHAGELNTEFVAAMQHGFGLNQILGTIHPYPTMSEANKYVAGVWKKTQTKTWVLNLLEKFHHFRRS
ncbi:MAG: FAD-dependent oxidoreductase [Deltaproteobacteria bacterium]|nr:FAD-dependent oxidoreductase [Deltaproteobacteria bacterium]